MTNEQLEENMKLQSVLNTLLEKCDNEKSTQELTVPVENVEERVAYYTGLPEKYIHQLNEQRLEREKLSLKVMPQHRVQISECLLEFYNSKKTPSLEEIFTLFCEMIPLKCTPTIAKSMKNLTYPVFKKLLVSCGYSSKKTACGYLVTENPKNVYERYFYLKKILKFRSSDRIFYYLDERVLDEKKDFKTISECFSENTDNLVYYYVLSKNNVKHGIFCNYIDRQEFMKWMMNIVIPSLEPHSVFVIKDTFIYGPRSVGPPSQYASKLVMLKWLRANKVPCSDKMRKAELYALVTRCRFSDSCNNIDQYLKVHGHDVLRLPRGFQDMTPTALAWQDESVQALFKDKANPKNVISKVIQQDLSVNGKWLQYENTIKEIEKQMFALDENIENALEFYDFIEHDLL